MAMTAGLCRAYQNCGFCPHSSLQSISPMSTTRHLVNLLSISRDPLFYFLHWWSKVQASQGSATAQKREGGSPEKGSPFSSCSWQASQQLPAEDPNVHQGRVSAAPLVLRWEASGLELASGNRGRWKQRKGKEPEKEAEILVETPTGSCSGASCPQNQGTNC